MARDELGRSHLLKPSSLLADGLRIEQINGLRLFKFTEYSQERMETLLTLRKERELTPEETAELEGLSELDRIFTYINAQLAAQR